MIGCYLFRVDGVRSGVFSECDGRVRRGDGVVVGFTQFVLFVTVLGRTLECFLVCLDTLGAARFWTARLALS